MSRTAEDIAWLKSTFRPIPRPALPEDCIEYSLFVIDPALDRANHSELRVELRAVQNFATALQRQWLKDYIWQREAFALELAKDNGEVCVLSNRTMKKDLTYLQTWRVCMDEPSTAILSRMNGLLCGCYVN